jgi:hypothetical protein
MLVNAENRQGMFQRMQTVSSEFRELKENESPGSRRWLQGAQLLKFDHRNRFWARRIAGLREINIR